MDRLTEDQLKIYPTRRTSIVRASMFKATQTTINYNWFAAGHYVGAMPTVEELINYGTVTSVAYNEEGMNLSESIFEGIKAMNRWAWDEGKGVVTRAKKMLPQGQKYGAGSVPSAYIRDETANTPEADYFDLNTQIASLGLEPAEERVLVLTAHGYTSQDLLDELGEHAEKILEEALNKAKVGWDGEGAHYGTQ